MNRIVLPPTLTYVGEMYTLQTAQAGTLRKSSCEFSVRGSAEAQEVQLVLVRDVGDVQVTLRSSNARPLPMGIPFQIKHVGIGCVVSEGRSTITAP
jgi:hypothetical protein